MIPITQKQVLYIVYPECCNHFFYLLVWERQSKNKNDPQRIVYISLKSMTVVTQSTLTALYEKQVVNKVTRNLADDTHMLH